MVKFKRTLAVSPSGDIDRDEQQKTWFRDGVSGVEQELRLTLGTVQGEQPFAPDFGLNVFEMAGATEPVIKREIRLALREDDRVQSVDEVLVENIDEANRTADVTVNLTLVDATNLTLDGVSL